MHFYIKHDIMFLSMRTKCKQKQEENLWGNRLVSTKINPRTIALVLVLILVIGIGSFCHIQKAEANNIELTTSSEATEEEREIKSEILADIISEIVNTDDINSIVSLLEEYGYLKEESDTNTITLKDNNTEFRVNEKEIKLICKSKEAGFGILTSDDVGITNPMQINDKEIEAKYKNNQLKQITIKY